MIIPCPEDLKQYNRYPITLMLVFLNLFIFIIIFSGQSSKKISNTLLEQQGLVVTGRLYYQYLQKLSPESLFVKPQWIQRLSSGNEDQMSVLGAYALRDGNFLRQAEKLEFQGDAIQIADWTAELKKFREQYQSQHLYRFGLSASKTAPLSWITYQFSHSNWIHLFSNLIFLMVMGAAVENIVGGSLLLLFYLGGGLAGGLSFVLLDPNSSVPMVGASASISALLAFYCMAEKRLRVRFYYLVSPLPGQYGAIYLPTLLIIPLFIVVDFANLLSSPEGLGNGVAYAAHVGGAIAGSVIALVYRWKAFILT